MKVSLRELLEAGAHFGHQTNRWNPKMQPFIFEARKGIYIIDLQKTLRQLDEACNVVEQAAAEGEYILLVGTKKQAMEVIRTEAEKCGMPYVCERWLGGTLTNMVTVRKSISRLEEIEQMEKDGSIERFTKKERVQINREKLKLLKNLGGIRNMDSLPAIMYVIDPEREKIAVKEAIKLNIPVVALIDTNCDPSKIEYPVPANDDAIKTISLITAKLAEAIMAGTSRISEDIKNQKVKAVKKHEKKPEKKEPPKRPKKTSRKSKNKKEPKINKINIDTDVFSEDTEEEFDREKKSRVSARKEKKGVAEKVKAQTKKEKKKTLGKVTEPDKEMIQKKAEGEGKGQKKETEKESDSSTKKKASRKKDTDKTNNEISEDKTSEKSSEKKETSKAEKE